MNEQIKNLDTSVKITAKENDLLTKLKKVENYQRKPKVCTSWIFMIGKCNCISGYVSFT